MEWGFQDRFPRIEIVNDDEGAWRLVAYLSDGRAFLVATRYESREAARAVLEKAHEVVMSLPGEWWRQSDDSSPIFIGHGHYSSDFIRKVALANRQPRRTMVREQGRMPESLPASNPTAIFRVLGQRGGSVAAGKTKEIRDRAQSLARERTPPGGWQSAPQAAEAIMADIRAFARQRGRNPSVRKVVEWLREAGIKRGRDT